MSDIVIAAAKRTAIGSFLGQFNGVPTPTLGATAIRAAMEQSGVAAADVSEVIMGCVLPANLGQAPARQASLAAGLPASTGCTTLNKVCGSGMKAIMLGHDLIKAGSASIVVAGGMESMSNAPHMIPNSRTGNRYGNFQAVDHMAWDGLTNPYDGQAMGVFAEGTVARFGFTREEQDAYAIESVKRAQAAQATGAFKDEIVAVKVATRKGEVEVDQDEQPGRSDIAKIPTLKPAFKKDGSVTAASSSSISDGAAAVVLMDAGDAARRGVQPLARIVAHATYAQEPECSPPRRSVRSGRCWTRPAGRSATWICSRSTKPSRWWRWRRSVNSASRMTSSTSTAAPARWAIRSAPRARAWWSRWSTPCAAVASSVASPPSASAAAKQRPSPSN